MPLVYAANVPSASGPALTLVTSVTRPTELKLTAAPLIAAPALSKRYQSKTVAVASADTPGGIPNVSR